MISHTIIAGNAHKDDRGSLIFFNNFDMKEIVRMYEVSPSSTEIVRAWQGHKEENKWFYCAAGTFIVNLMQIKNFDNPEKHIIPKRIILKATEPSILHITGGYATGFKAVEDNSRLMVFSDFSVAESQNDDFRFPLDQWNVNW